MFCLMFSNFPQIIPEINKTINKVFNKVDYLKRGEMVSSTKLRKSMD